MKEKQIQIPEILFTMMSAYVLMENYRTEENYKTIEKGLYEKYDRIVEHELYTRSLTAKTKEEKEKARKEYLERKGILPDFRW